MKKVRDFVDVVSFVTLVFIAKIQITQYIV